MKRKKQSFTLIELAAVAVIMGIAITMFIVKVDGVTSSTRLGAGARLVGSSIELALSDAVMKREPRSLVYNLKGRTMRVEKVSDLNPEEPVILAEYNLPRGVEIIEVEGAETVDGKAAVTVASSGRMVPHAAHLKSGAGEMTVEVYGLTGKIRYHKKRVELRKFTKETGEE
jgi:type II secretory pathway pseudopilin PulG